MTRTGDAGGLSIGLAMPARLDAAAWSGTPSGVAAGAREHGARVVHVGMAPPRLVERAVERLPGWRLRTAYEHAAFSWSVRRGSRDLDGVLLVGSQVPVHVDDRLALVTLEDMTVRQAVALGDAWVVQRPEVELRAWIARQEALYARADAICTLSPWAAASVVDDYGVDPERVHVVGAGINHRVDAGERDWSTPRLLFIGRDFERKNGPAVLRAFARLRAQRPDATLDVVGGHPPLRQPGVTGHGPLALDVPEERERIDALLRRATCFVMPSRYEPFGIAYVEAATAGVPSIATAVGGTFVGEDCGRRVDPADEEALLGAMLELSEGDVARALGERARERAKPYTWPLVSGRLLRCFARALGRPTDGLPEFIQPPQNLL